MNKVTSLIIVLSIAIIASILFQNSLVGIVSAQGPCPEGEFPETDSNGKSVINPLTGEPECNSGP